MQALLASFGCLAPLHLTHLTPFGEALPPWQSRQPMRDEAGSLPAAQFPQRGVVLVLCLPAPHGTQADLFMATSSPGLHEVQLAVFVSKYCVPPQALQPVASFLGASPLGHFSQAVLPLVETLPVPHLEQMWFVVLW